MKYIGPILYKNKLSVDRRAIDLNAKILLKEGATVTAGGVRFGTIPVGKVDWIWDHGDEVWAALELDGTPPAEDTLYPQIEVEHGQVDHRGNEIWFVGTLTIRSVHLGDCPMWPDLPPVKPS